MAESQHSRVCQRTRDQEAGTEGRVDEKGIRGQDPPNRKLVHSLTKKPPRKGRQSLRRLAEREGVRLRPAIEELNLELAIDNRIRLADQLVQPLLENGAVTAFIDVNATCRTWWPTVNSYSKAHSTVPS